MKPVRRRRGSPSTSVDWVACARTSWSDNRHRVDFSEDYLVPLLVQAGAHPSRTQKVRDYLATMTFNGLRVFVTIREDDSAGRTASRNAFDNFCVGWRLTLAQGAFGSSECVMTTRALVRPVAV